MSSPKYRELRGIEGISVAQKASVLTDPRKRSLIFFIQAMSLRPGGIKKFLDDVMGAFPERFCTVRMRKVGIEPGQIYSEQDTRAVLHELHDFGDYDYDSGDFIEAGITKEMRTAEYLLGRCRQSAKLDDALIEMCINPDCPIPLPEEGHVSAASDGFVLSRITSLEDFISALLDYQKTFAEKVREGLAATKTAERVWNALDRALQHRKMVVLEGEPGIGKTKATETWCEAHLGEARFVSLKGCVNKTSIFRAIGRAFGIGCGYMRGATELQARIEDVLQRSRMLLAVDESHFLFGQSERIYSRPEMIDWIDTALCNERVPVALVATPQLTKRLCQVEDQTMWQSSQFRRRIKDFTILESKIDIEDIRAVAKKLLPGCSEAGIKLAAGQARLSDWPLSWLADMAEDAILIAKSHSRETAQFEDVEEAIEKFRTPSDLAQKTSLARAQTDKKQRRRSKREDHPDEQQTEPVDLAPRSRMITNSLIEI
jgi:hypothetical protein